MSPPLLNEYKRSFAFRRVLQNLLGGPRLYPVPYQLIIIQLLIYLVPLVPLGITYATHLPSHISDHNLWRSLIFGISLLILDGLISFLILRIVKKEKNSIRPRDLEGEQRDLFAQEDYILYDGLCSPSTWCFIAPNVSFAIRYGSALLLSSATFAFCIPMLFHTIASNSKPGYLAIKVFGIFVLCNSRFSAVISSPPEIAIFDSNQKRSPFYRSFYVGVIGVLFFISTRFFDNGQDVFPYLLTLSLLPIGWGLGCLPPIDALFPWAIEQALILLGGTPSYFYFGSTIGLILALLYILLDFILGFSTIIGISLKPVFAHFILLNTSGLLTCTTTNITKVRLNGKQFLFGNLVAFIASIIAVSLTAVFLQNTTDMDLCSKVLAGLTVLAAILCYIAEIFLPKRKSTLSAGIIWARFLLNKMLTLMLHVWIAVEANEGKDGVPNDHLEVRSLQQMAGIALTVRAHASAIMDNSGCSFDMFLSFLLRFFTASNLFPNSIDFTSLLFLVWLGRRCGKILFEHFVLIVRMTRATLKSPRVEIKLKITVSVILALPMSITSWVLSGLIPGSTLTPLFTLPIFIFGFPRPASFWKGKWLKQKKKRALATESLSLDEAIYAGIGPHLIRQFAKRGSESGMRMEPRHAFVARYENRILLLRILARGLNFVYVGVKGLEMQDQTSCHHQESAWIDEIFDKNSNMGTSSSQSWEEKLFNVVQYFTDINVPAYSESKASILCIQKVEEKEILEKMFFRAFSYIWIKSKPAFRGESYWNPDSHRGSISSNYYYPAEKFLSGGGRNQRGSISGGGLDESSDNVDKISTSSTCAAVTEDENLEDMDWSLRWIQKCIGTTIPPRSIKDRVMKLTNNVWKLAHGASQTELNEIWLHSYFENDFLNNDDGKFLESENLIEITTKAFRYAAKLTLDEIFDLTNTNDPTVYAEDQIFDELSSYEKRYCFCSHAEIPSKLNSEDKDKRILLSILPTESGESQMKIFRYEYDGLKFHVGTIDSSVMEGIWSNLSLELLYLTSDDDERFSIQHDRYLMRNLLTQCADSPLGYPIYNKSFCVDLLRNFRVDRI